MPVTITRLPKPPENFFPEYVKFVLAGSVTELVSLQYAPKPIDVLRLSNDYYVKRSEMLYLDRFFDDDLRLSLDLSTQADCVELEQEIEWYISHDHTPPPDAKHIFSYIHSLDKSDYGCIQSVRRTLAKIRRIINTNCVNPDTLHWVTLTYAENMTDTKRLYRDFEVFMKRFVRWCKKQNYPPPEYITVVEPQGRGAWHCHCFFIWSIRRPMIDNNTVLAPMWGQGFTKIKGCDDNCDNVGAYFSAYLSDMSLEDYQKSGIGGSYEVITKEIDVDKEGQSIPKTEKKFVKGARLRLYPPNMRIFRTSRGVKQPTTREICNAEAEEVRLQSGRLTFESVVEVAPSEGESHRPQVCRKEFYNKRR